MTIAMQKSRMWEEDDAFECNSPSFDIKTKAICVLYLAIRGSRHDVVDTAKDAAVEILKMPTRSGQDYVRPPQTDHDEDWLDWETERYTGMLFREMADIIDQLNTESLMGRPEDFHGQPTKRLEYALSLMKEISGLIRVSDSLPEAFTTLVETVRKNEFPF